ncbi:MAG: CPBP family intramembrane glutamic endopeptidase [Candidatus Acidiferrales bacterium]
MSSERPTPPGFLATVGILLGAARQRAAGRRRRQQELFRQRSSNRSTDWGGFGFALTALVMTLLSIGAAYAVKIAVEAAERLQVERQGKIVVSSSFLDDVRSASQFSFPAADTYLANDYSTEANRIIESDGGKQSVVEQKLRDEVHAHGSRNLISRDEASPGITSLPTAGPLPAMVGSLVLLWWVVMLVFQGEGLELDLQRRRHPMWEWLFAHPVPPGAIFLAEMLSPIAANPIYWGGPLFAGFMYGFVYGAGAGLAAAALIGIPVTIAAACLGKALEIAVILRFSPRTRGAMTGLMSWLGYASMMLLFIGVVFIPKMVSALGKFLELFTWLPWPWLTLFLGGHPDGSFSFLSGMLACWIAAAITVAFAVRFSVWGAQQGLSGNFAADSTLARSKNAPARFGKEPLYRKEFLWFIRDRSAIVQTILIPLTIAGFQVVNLRGVLGHAQDEWNYLCGAAILFGTYFLWILGPKSLTSEGPALWIALTWPRGLESLLKAKAWLWSMIASAMVALVLCYAVFQFPGKIWQIALVGVGWFIFGRSMAEKTVTLVTVTSSSGEPEKISWGRRWAAQLGMLTFSIGVLTQEWQLAVVGIVYSYITAAAMWEDFRARLPYLYDPWSEKFPPPPTLMHAMVAISILIELGAVFMGLVMAIFGSENAAAALAVGYGLCAIVVSIGVTNFLANRDVSWRDIWFWPPPGSINKAQASLRGIFSREAQPAFLAGAAGGVLLGFLARGYVAILLHIPASAELIRKSQEQMAKISGLRASYVVIAVLLAPFAEEYLFRGLLFRALDREWGGWRAVVGSAAFFAIYHPALSWLPVGLLGVTNAILFKKTGRLAPAVVLHMVYNAIVLS